MLLSLYIILYIILYFGYIYAVNLIHYVHVSLIYTAVHVIYNSIYTIFILIKVFAISLMEMESFTLMHQV